LDLSNLADDLEALELSSLQSSLQAVTNAPHPKCIADAEAFVFDEKQKNEAEVTDLRERLQIPAGKPSMGAGAGLRLSYPRWGVRVFAGCRYGYGH